MKSDIELIRACGGTVYGPMLCHVDIDVMNCLNELSMRETKKGKGRDSGSPYIEVEINFYDCLYLGLESLYGEPDEDGYRNSLERLNVHGLIEILDVNGDIYKLKLLKCEETFATHANVN